MIGNAEPAPVSGNLKMWIRPTSLFELRRDKKNGIEFAMLFTLETTRNAGGLKFLCCQGFEVKNYDFTLDALNLKPSEFCNVGADST